MGKFMHRNSFIPVHENNSQSFMIDFITFVSLYLENVTKKASNIIEVSVTLYWPQLLNMCKHDSLRDDFRRGLGKVKILTCTHSNALYIIYHDI